MDFRPIFLIIGVLLAALAVSMTVPAAVDVFAGYADWQVFAVSAGVTLFVGIAMMLTCRAGGRHLSVRQTFVMTTLSWLLLAFFAALPFSFSGLGISFTDAFFEAVSGITTTGSTVISGLDAAPPGILIWRALLQWLGGIGVIVMAVSILPILRIGGMQLFRVQSSEAAEKTMPRAAMMAGAIGLVYLALSLALAVAYWLAGMSGFDAFAHAMTTISTGGFSTSDASLGHFQNATIEIIAIAGMLVGSLPFVLYLKTVQGDFRTLLRDGQVQWFISVVFFLVVITAGWLWLADAMDPVRALRYASFSIVSIITGTGYVNTNYGLWGSFAVPIFFFIMFIGGCAGSTTGGVKAFRFQVLYAAARSQLHTLLQPHGVFIPYYNRRPIPGEVIVSVLSFFFVFGISFAALAMGLGILGLDFLTAISSAATAIANVGPALGPIAGPVGNFATLPDAAKWLLSAGMLLGRLELFTALVLFNPAFWRS
jgi:trk system potassium uptake protein TrkH